MGFDVPADAYDRFMGRFSTQLSGQLCELTGLEAGHRAVDVGCGPGALTEELVRRLGADAVTAVDPSEPFVAAARSRFPEVEVIHGPAEGLPLADESYDAALAQLVVQFMDDPRAGVGEMRRVTRTGGVVAASVWDHGGGTGPLSPFWRAVNELEPGAGGETTALGTHAGQLAGLFHDVGLGDVEETALTASVEYASFEEWWEPYELGVGTAGAYLAGLDPEARAAVRERCRAQHPAGPFTVHARAWTAVGRV